MALIHCDFKSVVLGLSTSICVILPEPQRDTNGKLLDGNQVKFPTLYLLHGMSDDHTIWQRRTSIERYAALYNLAVVMPAVGRSFYTDMAYGLRYFTYITDELPGLVCSLFPLSDKRENNYVAGLSMGGYGAFKIAMTYPDRYAAAASLSGAVDIVALSQKRNHPMRKEFRNIFGPAKNITGGANDLITLASQLSESSWNSIPLYAWCGTEDALYQNNVTFAARMKELGLNYVFEEGPGEHEWGAWDKMIQRVLQLFLEGEKPEESEAEISHDDVQEEENKKVPVLKKEKKKGKKKKKK
jgi:putative tributyrin esterase